MAQDIQQALYDQPEDSQRSSAAKEVAVQEVLKDVSSSSRKIPVKEALNDASSSSPKNPVLEAVSDFTLVSPKEKDIAFYSKDFALSSPKNPILELMPSDASSSKNPSKDASHDAKFSWLKNNFEKAMPDIPFPAIKGSAKAIPLQGAMEDNTFHSLGYVDVLRDMKNSINNNILIHSKELLRKEELTKKKIAPHINNAHMLSHTKELIQKEKSIRNINSNILAHAKEIIQKDNLGSNDPRRNIAPRHRVPPNMSPRMLMRSRGYAHRVAVSITVLLLMLHKC